MPLRSLTFTCANGHEFEELRSFERSEDIPAEHFAQCPNPSCTADAMAFNIRPGHAPGLGGQNQRSGRFGSISRGEAVQAKAQFGVTPKNRGELNELLKRTGHVAVSDKEFSQLMDQRDAVQEAAKKKGMNAEQKAAMATFIKNRRERFRSGYDHGDIPKRVEQDTEVASAAAAVGRDPLGR